MAPPLNQRHCLDIAAAAGAEVSGSPVSAARLKSSSMAVTARPAACRIEEATL
jgi:hypothetical protein